MKRHMHTTKPMGFGNYDAPACVSRTIAPWAAFGAALRMQERHTNAVVRPKGLTEGSTV